MFSHQPRLETPPPPSQFRRPWSPVEEAERGRPTLRFREPSEPSVEALDLADYALTLQHTNDSIMRASGPYPPFSDDSRYPEYPSTPPRSFSLASRDTHWSIPSLTSGVTSSVGSQPRSSGPRTPSQRPFSLPPPRTPQTPPNPSLQYAPRMPRIFEPRLHSSPEVDVSRFPDWSKDWYDAEKQIAVPYSQGWDTSSYSHNLDFLQPYSSTSDGSHRNLLPWTGDDEARSQVTGEMKEERMRMLEKEFNVHSRGSAESGSDKRVVGSVDKKGSMVTAGPKKRALVRWSQWILVIGAATASLYSALLLKPKGSPPPRGTIPAYLLYVLSIFTILLLLFLLFRNCCGGKRKNITSFEGPAGMMVLPIQGFPGSKVGKKRKKKGDGKGKGSNGGSNEGVQVNLIVDPSMFGKDSRPDHREGGDDDEPGDRDHGGGRRRGVFEGLAMEEQWKYARKQLKARLYFDIAFFFLWGAEFIVILLGKRCPVGKFQGWCDGYNVATALACLLTFAFGFSVFFGIKDLHMSRLSPRSRT